MNDARAGEKDPAIKNFFAHKVGSRVSLPKGRFNQDFS
jgi:hypothetical protein